MHVLFFVLFLLAVCCFVAVAFNVRTDRVNLLGLGLALATAVFMIQQLRLL